MSLESPKKRLVLHVEIPGLWADDLDELAGYCSQPNPPTDSDRFYVVTQEWMREEVGLTIVTQPGEKNMNSDFEVHSYDARIVGVSLKDVADPGVPTCRVCGCTDDEACAGGCHWVEADLCSECAP